MRGSKEHEIHSISVIVKNLHSVKPDCWK